MMDNLKKLMAKCRCSVSVTVNDHRNYYDTAAQALKEAEEYECPPKIEPEVREKMIATDTIVKVQFYPDTPIGSYCIWHHDLDAALVIALSCFKD